MRIIMIEHIIEIIIPLAVVAILNMILQLVARRNRKLAEGISTVVMIISAGFLILVILFVILLLLNSKLHFWY